MDGTGWTATGIAGAEAITIAALIVRRRASSRGRRLRAVICYEGPDHTEEIDQQRPGEVAGRSQEPLTPPAAADGPPE